ncbi:MAG: hypothetical protein RR140_02580 [Clostridia bacterium]
MTRKYIEEMLSKNTDPLKNRMTNCLIKVTNMISQDMRNSLFDCEDLLCSKSGVITKYFFGNDPNWFNKTSEDWEECVDLIFDTIKGMFTQNQIKILSESEVYSKNFEIAYSLMAKYYRHVDIAEIPVYNSKGKEYDSFLIEVMHKMFNELENKFSYTCINKYKQNNKNNCQENLYEIKEEFCK